MRACVLKGVSVGRLGEEFPSRSGRDEETAGNDGFLLHCKTSGYSSCERSEEKHLKGDDSNLSAHDK